MYFFAVAGTSEYLSMSTFSQKTPEKYQIYKTLCSELTSGLKSLDSIPDSDGEPDSEYNTCPI